MLRFASLASGSKGNALVVEAGASRVLLDCGLAPREAARRLGALGLEPGQLDAILITHEHDDHCAGAFGFAAAHGLKVLATRGTLRALEEAGKRLDGVVVVPIDGRGPVALGDLELHPFTVPHDAREPVQATFSDGAFRLGVLTDLGASTAHVEAQLARCEALVLECNHDLEMLWAGRYPKWLKRRIGGPFGHLDNGAAAALLGAVAGGRLRHVVAAHLSEANNRPQLARAALAGALGCSEDWIGIATQEAGFGWRELR